jgi:hypothetical protein
MKKINKANSGDFNFIKLLALIVSALKLILEIITLFAVHK